MQAAKLISLAEEALAAGQPLQALVLCDRALSLQPRLSTAVLARARALAAAGRVHEAVACCEQVLALDQDCAPAYAERARCHHELGEEQRAIADYRQALRLQPQQAHWLIACAILLGDAGDPAGAQDLLLQARDIAGARERAAFLLAALGAGAAPPAPPSGYVGALFDSYAPRFERHLTKRLRYRAPQLIADALLPAIGPGSARIVDLGCGTGLAGQLLRCAARRLDGVDLSPGMIERARAKEIYDVLHVGDLVAFLGGKRASYDVAVAADVFVYLGDLAPVFDALRQALSAEGLVAFTVEALDEGEFRLQPTRRYAHSRRYIEEVARGCGFAPAGITRRALRLNGETEISGYVAVFRRRREGR